MVWGGIGIGSHTDLYVIRGGLLTTWCRDEILRPTVLPYAGAVGGAFILLDDNAQGRFGDRDA